MNAKLATLFLVAFGLVHQGAATTFIVRTTANEGPGSLRDAIWNVNTGQVDRIEFRILPMDDTVKTIVLSNALPSITNPVAIDGYTQGTASRNTLTNGNDARILIELTVPPASVPLQSFNGLTFAVGNNTVEGLSLHGFDNGIVLGTTSSNNRVLGNFIGLRPSGVFAGSLSNQHGIVIGGPNNRIGGPLPGERNIISGNFGNGILISDPRATNNVIQGNFIGTDSHGTGEAPNGGGISLSARHTRIGGYDPGTGNVISGNAGNGIIIGLGADYTIVQNNLIGTDVSGTLPLGNNAAAVSLASAFNEIGSATIDLLNPVPDRPGLPRGNIISGNNSTAIFINVASASNNTVVANLIGTDITGTNGLTNWGNGILIFQANRTSIGRYDLTGKPALGNVISASLGSGIFAVGLSVEGLTIADNRIGTDINGVGDLGNMEAGIVFGSARNSVIEGNVIAYNDNVGVAMDSRSTNNLIGSDRAPNAIFNNGLLGVDLESALNPFSGVTINDNCDIDVNVANFGQNFPVITLVTNTPNGARIEGFLNGPVDSEYNLNFFINDHCDASGHGEGARWIASTSMAIGPNCRGTFSAISSSPIPGCHFITATATGAGNNTSEFSQCYAIGEFGGCTATPLGMTNWWPGEGIATNLAVGGASVVLSNGTVFAAGKVGAAFSFDGTNDFASVPDSHSLRPTSFTLEAWVNFRNVSGGNRRLLMGKPVGSGFNNSYVMFLQNGTFGAAIANATTVANLQSTFAPASNTWYHVAYTYNRADSNHAFYVNGVLQRRATANVTNSYDANPFLMGADQNNGTLGEFFNGLLDEPTIYDRVLSSEELQNIFCAGSLGKCREPLGPCSIVCPSDIITNTAAGQCGATIYFSMPAVTGDCSVVCTPAPGSFFPLGTNTVTCTTNGVVACTFKIIINDTERPTITCPADITVNTATGLCTRVVNFNPVVSDNCPGVTLVCNPPSGFAFPRGSTTVSCTATDAAGNTSTCEFDVIVNDAEPPTITCPTNVFVEVAVGRTNAIVNYPSPTASDNCAGVVVNSDPAAGFTFPIGTNTVFCSATDAAGNTAFCQFLVVVRSPGLRFSGIRVEGNDVRVSWQAQSGTTNRVQSAPTLTSTFTNLSPDIVIPGTGMVSTNFLDTGGAATGRSRFYRVRLLP